MATASYMPTLGQKFGPKMFAAPKRASDLKYWYKAAKRVIPMLPEWQESFRGTAAIDELVIHINLGRWGDLFIARKKGDGVG